MTAINNLKITSNNDAIDGLKSKKMIRALKVSLIHWKLVIKKLNIKENPKNIENNSKDDKEKKFKRRESDNLKKTE